MYLDIYLLKIKISINIYIFIKQAKTQTACHTDMHPDGARNW
jgi:hypothetical protein